jgi:hypothetical protein
MRTRLFVDKQQQQQQEDFFFANNINTLISLFLCLHFSYSFVLFRFLFYYITKFCEQNKKKTEDEKERAKEKKNYFNFSSIWNQI